MDVQEISIRDHTLAALPFNPDTPGAPIILLHGVTASIHFWTPEILAPFIERGPCTALSLPGHYPARFPAGFRGPLTASLFVDLLAEAIQQIAGGRRALLVGHSTGGFAALALAASTPLACGVVCLSGFAHGVWTGAFTSLQKTARGGPFSRLLFHLVFNVNRATFGVQRTSWGIYAGNMDRLMSNPDLDVSARQMYPDFRQLNIGSILTYFRDMPDIDISARLPAIGVPTLVETGSRDPIVPPAQARLIASRVPHSELVEIEGAGHLPFFECPGDHQHALQAWLGRHYG